MHIYQYQYIKTSISIYQNIYTNISKHQYQYIKLTIVCRTNLQNEDLLSASCSSPKVGPSTESSPELIFFTNWTLHPRPRSGCNIFASKLPPPSRHRWMQTCQASPSPRTSERFWQQRLQASQKRPPATRDKKLLVRNAYQTFQSVRTLQLRTPRVKIDLGAVFATNRAPRAAFQLVPYYNYP